MSGNERHVRIAIVGTGFSGLGAAIGLKRSGHDDFVILERAGDVGGTWRDNSYPGCQCDVPSHLYSFSFRPNPEWTRTYSMQPEIWDYLRRCAEEAGVLEHIRFDHDVTNARWDDEGKLWSIDTSQGTWTCRILISANGGLAEPAVPDIPGLDRFEGSIVHSATWDPSVDLAGKKVAVVGTGASAIQIVPSIQPLVDKLLLFQRTPAWVLPHTDRPISTWERALFRRWPILQKFLRGGIYAAREALVPGMAKRPKLLKPLRRIALGHLHRQVHDRELRRKLTPSFTPGCKRLLLSNRFYPAVAAANSELITAPIKEFDRSSVITSDEAEHQIDVLVLATGFRVTDNPAMERVFGRDGRSLAQRWDETGMQAYLGTTVPGFPNLFLMTGPNTGIGHTSLVVMIEAQIRYILHCLQYMDRNDVVEVEVRTEVTERFNARLQQQMRNTVWTMGGCASWYLDDKGNNPTLWPDFTWKFRRLTRRFDPAAYLIGRTDKGRARVALKEVSA